MRAAPPTNRPISGRRRNLRFPETLSGKSGNRDFGISSGIHRGGGLLDSGGAFSDVSAKCLLAGFRRTRGPEIDRLRRPAGVRIRESPRPQIARFRADARFAKSGDIVGAIRKSGFRDLVGNSCGGFIRFRRRVIWRLRRVLARGFPAKTGPADLLMASTGVCPRLRATPPANRPISGWRENLRFQGTLSGESGSRDFGIASGIRGGRGLSDSIGAFSDVAVARFTEGLRRKRGRQID